MNVVYAIANLETDKRYVGSTTRKQHRWQDHWRMLRQGRHHAPKLQASYDRWGELCFEIRVLEEVPREEDLEAREQHWINLLDSHQNGYNTLPDASTTTPVLQRARCVKRWADPAQREKHSKAMKRLWREGHKFGRQA